MTEDGREEMFDISLLAEADLYDLKSRYGGHSLVEAVIKKAPPGGTGCSSNKEGEKVKINIGFEKLSI